MTYAEAIEFLYSLRLFGAKFGLSNTLKLAEMSGNPQERLKFIHVAGTNGKGSTCAMLESIYRAAGLRVGLFTSPHLVEFGERIQVNRQSISEADIIRHVGDMKPLLEQFPKEHHPTFFEVVTVMALRYFAEQKCELVIWETGLGGRLDATNIVTPLVSVITNIQYDHEKWLGSTLANIAGEKAGIIKPGVPVVTAADEPEALQVIRDVALSNKSSLTVVTPGDLERPPLDTIELPLLGYHQRLNAAVAIATVKTLQEVIPVKDESVRHGLLGVQWPGRLQMLTDSGRKILLDGAHNVAGANALAASLRKYFHDEPFTLVLGALADKNWEQICQILAPLARRIFVVPVESDRTASPGALAESCRSANRAVFQAANIRHALQETERDAFVVITGSLYLVGEALEALEKGSPARPDERNLNEWQIALHKRS